MKLLAAAFSYLVFVGAVIVAAIAAIAAIERRQPQDGPILARGEDRVSRKARALEVAKVDPNRVPVWIAATAKYQYTPVPVDPPKHRALIISNDARGAMAKARTGPVPEHVEAEAAAPRTTHSSRDNDPFFRD